MLYLLYDMCVGLTDTPFIFVGGIIIATINQPINTWQINHLSISS